MDYSLKLIDEDQVDLLEKHLLAVEKSFGHLSPIVIGKYARNKADLTTEELLMVEEHLAHCERCQKQIPISNHLI